MAELCFDSYGNPFILFKDQDKQRRLTGNDAIKVSEFFVENTPGTSGPMILIFLEFYTDFLDRMLSFL